MFVKLILRIWDRKEEARRIRARHWRCGEDVLAVVTWV
jgi:hypothetical protein